MFFEGSSESSLSQLEKPTPSESLPLQTSRPTWNQSQPPHFLASKLPLPNHPNPRKNQTCKILGSRLHQQVDTLLQKIEETVEHRANFCKKWFQNLLTEKSLWEAKNLADWRLFVISEFVEKLVARVGECGKNCGRKEEKELCHTFPNHIEQSEIVEFGKVEKLSAQSQDQIGRETELQNGKKILLIEYFGFFVFLYFLRDICFYFSDYMFFCLFKVLFLIELCSKFKIFMLYLFQIKRRYW